MDPLAADVVETILIKGTLVLLVTAFLTHLLRKRSAATRHAVWMTGLTCLLALPVLDVVLPVRHVGIYQSPFAGLVGELPLLEDVAAPAAEGAGSTEVDWTDADTRATGVAPATSPSPTADGRSPYAIGVRATLFLLFVWGVGALLLIVRFPADWIRLAWLTRRSHVALDPDPVARLVEDERNRQGIRQRVRVVYSDRIGVPVTSGALRPVIILPLEAAGWSNERLGAVVIHELAHVRRLDYLSHLLNELVRVAYWPNPLAWLALRRARIERERACDDEVLVRGTGSSEYARFLLELARGLTREDPAVRGAMAMARPSMLRTRITGVLDKATDRRRAAWATVLLVTPLLLTTVAPLASVRLWASPPGYETVSELIARLDASSNEARIDAARRLGTIGSSQAVRPLLEVVDNADRDLRIAIYGALGRIGDERAIRVLAETFGDPEADLYERKVAAASLARIDDAEAAAALVSQLGAPERQVRLIATLSLAKMWGQRERAVPALIQRLKRDNDTLVRVQTVHALRNLSCGDAISGLIEATWDPAPEVRRAAARGLANFGGELASRALFQLQDDPDPEVRAIACEGTAADRDAS